MTNPVINAPQHASSAPLPNAPEAIDPQYHVVLPVSGVDVVGHSLRAVHYMYMASQGRARNEANAFLRSQAPQGSIARNEILLGLVRTNGIQLSAAVRDTIITRYRADFAQLVAAVGVSAESLAADTVARHSRAQAASQRVDAYFAGITSNPPQRAFVELPPFLGDLLRERYPWNLSPAGVDRAVERAKEIRGPETPQSPVPMMQPAPGGPPVGSAPPQAPGGARRPRQ